MEMEENPGRGGRDEGEVRVKKAKEESKVERVEEIFVDSSKFLLSDGNIYRNLPPLHEAAGHCDCHCLNSQRILTPS